MRYSDIIRVRHINGAKFVEDFKRVQCCALYVYVSNCFVHVQRIDIWRIAKDKKLQYIISDELYKDKKEAMIIL